MTSFELSLLLMGAFALIFGVWAVQYMGRIWTNHLDRLRAMNEKMLLEIMRCNDRLVSITESFRNLDK